jgi:hypothetical protein
LDILRGRFHLMAELVCGTCGSRFQGRPNRRYCSRRCRKRAERAATARKAHSAWVASLRPPEGSPWDSLPPADWGPATDWSDLRHWTD